MKRNGILRGQSRPGSEIFAALILALGVTIERARGRHAWMAAVPIIIVNYVAYRAQLRFWQDHLGRTDAFLVSIALESVAVYWSWLAHQALVADDSALRPRLAAYGIALVIGVLNYSHYCRPGWKPTVAAVTFGGMSVISPWLWTAYSRRISRPLLKAKNLIEDHAVRLGITRWFFHAYRCARVMHRATWTGENRPAEAIQLVYPDQPGHDGGSGEDYAQKASRAPGVTAVPVATAEKPPLVPASRNRETASGVVPGRAARTTGLVAASDHEAEVVLRLVTSGHPLPSIRTLAASDFNGGIRASQRVLELARSRMNGAGHDDAGRI
jgi:hypothetical protein